MLSKQELNGMAETLTSTGEFKVQYKFHPVDGYNTSPPNPEDLRVALSLDTETTGLDCETDKIIELGAVVFEYDHKTGIIYNILDVIGMLDDPLRPLEPIITDITGITDEQLAGQKFDDDEVNTWLDVADIIICHNAGFDQNFVVRRFPKMAEKPFICSMKDLDWKTEFNAPSLSQQVIASTLGFFYDAHRAEEDASALLHILSHSLPESGKPILLELLENARKIECKVWAANAAFDKKDALKGRDYRWHDPAPYGNQGKCWAKVVSADELDDEQAWLQQEVFGNPRSAPVTEITAFNRYLKD